MASRPTAPVPEELRAFSRASGEKLAKPVAIESGDPAAFRVSGRATAGERTIATSLFTFRMVDVASMVAPEHRAAWERAIAVWLGEYPGSGDA